MGTLQPAARCAADEMAFKLDVPGLRIHFDRVYQHPDLAGKARAVGILVRKRA